MHAGVENLVFRVRKLAGEGHCLHFCPLSTFSHWETMPCSGVSEYTDEVEAMMDGELQSDVC